MTNRRGRFQPIRVALWLLLVLAVGAVSVVVCNAQSTASSARISVRDLRAEGHALILRDAVLSAGSATLNSASASFSPAEAGRRIYLMSGGTSGGPLDTHIRSVINSHTALLSTVAAASASNVCATIGGDDWKAIQSDLDQAGAKGGGTVFLPAGTYMISRPLLVMGSNIRLTGEGSQTVIIEPTLTKRPNLLKNVAGDQIYHLAGGWAPSRAILVGKEGATISNIELDHLSVQSPPVLWVHSNIGQSLIMTGTDARYTVNNFKLHDMNFGATSLYAYSNGGYLSGFAIHDNTISDASKAAIYLAGMPSNGVVAKNHINTNFINRASVSVAIIGKNMNNVRIEDNVITGNFGICIGGLGFPERNITVDHNYCALNPRLGSDGISFDHGNDILVTNNTVENAGSFGITFRGPDSVIANIRVSDNVVAKANGAAISIMGGRQPANGPRNVTIDSNRLTDSVVGIEALKVKGSSVIRDNVIVGSATGRCTALNITVFAGASLKCQGNRITNCAGGTFLCD